MTSLDNSVFVYETVAAIGERTPDFLRSSFSSHYRGGEGCNIESSLQVLTSSSNQFEQKNENFESCNSGHVEQEPFKTPDFKTGQGTGSRDEEVGFLALESCEVTEVKIADSTGKKKVSTEALNSAVKKAPPWARRRSSHGTWFQSPLLQLHQEILDFCEFVSPTTEEQSRRSAAVERVRAVVLSIWPACQVKVFGSFATGLFLPTSDVDVVILNSGCQVPQSGLKALAKALTRKSLAKNLQVIGKARVPIIKFVEAESSIPFDISFDVANGPDAAEFIRDAMVALPPLKPLCLVLKIFLQQRELNEVYTGGIGSYALIVMLLNHLQMHPSRKAFNSRGEHRPLEGNLGILLVDFFDFYGRALNVRDVGISCRNGGQFFSKKSRGFIDTNRPYLLSVEDPQTPDNDIGKNSYNVTKVRSAFVLAHRLLTNLEIEDVPSHVGLLGRIVRLDEKLVERKAPISTVLNSQFSFNQHHYPALPNEDSSLSASDGEPAIYEPKNSRRSRWQDYEDEDFPRGHDPEEVMGKRKRAKESSKAGKGEKRSRSSSHLHKHKKSEDSGEFSGKNRKSRRKKEHQGTTPVDECSDLSKCFEHREKGLEKIGVSQRVASKGKSHRLSKSQRKGAVSCDWEGMIGEGKGKRRFKKIVDDDEGCEEGEIAFRDDGFTFGMGNGLNNHKRWFNDSGSPRGRQGHRAWIPESEDNGKNRRRVVITKPAHKKIKYV